MLTSILETLSGFLNDASEEIQQWIKQKLIRLAALIAIDIVLAIYFFMTGHGLWIGWLGVAINLLPLTIILDRKVLTRIGILGALSALLRKSENTVESNDTVVSKSSTTTTAENKPRGSTDNTYETTTVVHKKTTEKYDLMAGIKIFATVYLYFSVYVSVFHLWVILASILKIKVSFTVMGILAISIPYVFTGDRLYRYFSTTFRTVSYYTNLVMLLGYLGLCIYNASPNGYWLSIAGFNKPSLGISEQTRKIGEIAELVKKRDSQKVDPFFNEYLENIDTIMKFRDGQAAAIRKLSQLDPNDLNDQCKDCHLATPGEQEAYDWYKAVMEDPKDILGIKKYAPYHNIFMLYQGMLTDESAPAVVLRSAREAVYDAARAGRCVWRVTKKGAESAANGVKAAGASTASAGRYVKNKAVQAGQDINEMAGQAYDASADLAHKKDQEFRGVVNDVKGSGLLARAFGPTEDEIFEAQLRANNQRLREKGEF